MQDYNYSIIIPEFNEEKSIRELYRRICSVMDKIEKNKYEIIFINDGSTDNSALIIKGIIKKDSNVKLYSFRKNLGKSAALMTGFKKSNGKFIITMDSDLQDEPKEIVKLIKKMRDGNLDIVSGWKFKRHDSFIKVQCSKIYNYLLSKAAGIRIHDFNCGFKLYKRSVVMKLNLYGDLYRFIPFLAYEEGFRVGEVEVIHHPRKFGKSKYSVLRKASGLLDFFTYIFLTKFGESPLHLFGTLGTLFMVIGIGMIIDLTYLHFEGVSIARRPLLIFSVLFIVSGLQFIFTGLLAEMLTKFNNNSSKKHPILEED